MSVALGIQHAVRMRSIILSSMLFYIALPKTVLTSVLSAVSVVQLFVDIQGVFVVKLFAKDVGISLILNYLKTLWAVFVLAVVKSAVKDRLWGRRERF